MTEYACAFDARGHSTELIPMFASVIVVLLAGFFARARADASASVLALGRRVQR